jgi:hypothetical protein
MAKLTFIAVTLIAATASVAAYGQNSNGQTSGAQTGGAQTGGALVAPELSQPAPGHLADQDYLTSTGATVPRPGVPQASGPTALDRQIQREDNRIDNSICNGC